MLFVYSKLDYKKDVCEIWSYTIKVDTNKCFIVCLRRYKSEKTLCQDLNVMMRNLNSLSSSSIKTRILLSTEKKESTFEKIFP